MREGSLGEVIFKLRAPGCQQGRRQDELIQAEKTAPGGAGRVGISHRFHLWSLNTCLRIPRLLPENAFSRWAQEFAFLAESVGDSLLDEGHCRGGREGNGVTRRGEKRSKGEIGENGQARPSCSWGS